MFSKSYINPLEPSIKIRPSIQLNAKKKIANRCNFSTANSKYSRI